LGMQIAKVQESLARKALYQPNTKFDDLFSLVAHPYWLWVATESVLTGSSASIPGVDGVTGDKVQRRDFAEELAESLKRGEYAPLAVRRDEVLNADGSTRPVGIATLRDRVVQEAARMVLEPILESHFLNCSVGFRPGRRAMDAIHLITRFASNQVKMWWVIQGQIEDSWNAIPHNRLQGVLRQYIADKKLLKLLTSLMHAGVMVCGKVAILDHGVWQTGILAPLLLNIYLHELDKVWWSRYGSLTEKEKTARRKEGLGNVQLMRYADAFVALTNGDKAFATSLYQEFADVVEELGLKLSEKSGIIHMNDGFDFLGFRIQRVHSTMSNKNMVLVKPSAHNLEGIKDALRSMTGRDTAADDVANKIRAINALIRDWTDYYRFANAQKEFAELDHFAHMRLYYWLKARHSNLSARESIKKFVLQNYLTQFTPARKTWGVHGVKLIPATSISRKRYYIRWPKERNPYLSYGETQQKVTDDVPLPDSKHIWRGHSEQSAYAIARLERLAQVGHKCEECGSSEGYLHAHHVIPQRKNGPHTVGNLRILCERCHVKTYSEK